MEDKVRVLAITIDKGIITLLEPTGEINYYRQRGIGQYKGEKLDVLIRAGKLDPRYKQVKELPRNYKIFFENEDIMGKAYASFNPNRK